MYICAPCGWLRLRISASPMKEHLSKLLWSSTRHGAGPLVRPDSRECHRGGGGEAERKHDTATVARVVLRGPRQAGVAASSPPGRGLLCAAAGVDRELVAGDPTGPGLG